MSARFAIPLLAALAALGSLAPSPAAGRPGFGDHILSIDHRVDHVSTVPANAGELVKLFVRERVLAGEAQTLRGTAATGKVVLFVHGGTYPSVPDFDLDFEDYSWMAYLAQAGFDVFAMDQTGYGGSPRPTMDDPCNVQAADQPLLVPDPLPAPCPPSYPFQLVNSQSEWDEIDTVVDYIRALRGVDRVHLIGWSGGGARVGGYTSRYGAKVDKLIIFASSSYSRTGPGSPPAVLPRPGAPMGIQDRAELEGLRWDPFVGCEGQVEPGVRDAVWALNEAFDPVGASWGPGVVRAPSRTQWGWNREAAGRITQPTLVMVGEFDGLLASNRLIHEDLGATRKVFLEVACASHFAVWEKSRHVLHEASRSWLLHGSIIGVTGGAVAADAEGRIRKVAE